MSVLTNTPTRAAQRSPGGVQLSAILEPVIDDAAKKLGIDRLAIRRINAPTHETTYGEHGEHLTSAFSQELFDKAEETFDWSNQSRLSGQRRGAIVTGIGLGYSTYHAGSRGYDGLMVIRPDGTLRIQTGVGNLGTGSFADVARVAAKELGVPWDKCVVTWGDTSKTLAVDRDPGRKQHHAHGVASESRGSAGCQTKAPGDRGHGSGRRSGRL